MEGGHTEGKTGLHIHRGADNRKERKGRKKKQNWTYIRKTSTQSETGNTNIREHDHTVTMVDTQTWRPAFEPKLKLLFCLLPHFLQWIHHLYRTNQSRQMAAALEHVHVRVCLQLMNLTVFSSIFFACCNKMPVHVRFNYWTGSNFLHTVTQSGPV